MASFFLPEVISCSLKSTFCVSPFLISMFVTQETFVFSSSVEFVFLSRVFFFQGKDGMIWKKIFFRFSCAHYFQGDANVLNIFVLRRWTLLSCIIWCNADAWNASMTFRLFICFWNCLIVSLPSEMCSPNAMRCFVTAETEQSVSVRMHFGGIKKQNKIWSLINSLWIFWLWVITIYQNQS